MRRSLLVWSRPLRALTAVALLSAVSAQGQEVVPFDQLNPALALSQLKSRFSDTTIERAQKLYQRLTGNPIRLNHSTFLRMVELVDQGDLAAAAEIATGERGFLNTRMVNFATKFTNKERSPDKEFNDLAALIVGITRDDSDSRELLTADYRYEIRTISAPVSLNDNVHYQAFNPIRHELKHDFVKEADQWGEFEEAAGALTTRAFAEEFYSAGTNRRAVQYAMELFLCRPIDYWKTAELRDDYVRRDVDRAPGGEPMTYLNTCKHCHSPMDAMGGAFAKMDYIDNALVMHAGIAPKMNQNRDVYPEGRITENANWINLLTGLPHQGFGWQGENSGSGIAAYGAMLARSAAFGRCLVSRVVEEICDPQALRDQGFLGSLARDFETDGYKLRNLFINAAVAPACAGR